VYVIYVYTLYFVVCNFRHENEETSGRPVGTAGLKDVTCSFPVWSTIFAVVMNIVVFLWLLLHIYLFTKSPDVRFFFGWRIWVTRLTMASVVWTTWPALNLWFLRDYNERYIAEQYPVAAVRKIQSNYTLVVELM